MAYVGAGLIVLAILVVLGRAFVAADARMIVRVIRYLLGAGLVVFGVAMSFAERWGVGLILISLGVSAIATGRIGPFDLGGGRRSAGSQSVVRSRFFEMSLDHDSGAVRGQVLAGRFSGRVLDDLDEEALRVLAAEIAGDPESVALFEAYLDRRMPGWREHVEADAAAGAGGTADSGPMTDEEAYQILGLAPGASDGEVRAAHRRLMMRMHPDQGGSTFLAAKINQAKDRLLGKHR
jgi:DnaJ-domain-containing protein 1